jgi:flagellin
MAFSINTNIASLQAQYYLNKTQQFQAKTINEVTSGLRIVNSGDDAAGLAVANSYRSDQAVLTQGIQNLNSATSTLQTIDGGMSNIGNLLDRARTLATQSSSTTFTGDRTALNSEFQSVMTEINRQAQASGINVGGTFAKSLQVFVGGGSGSDATGTISNGTITADLTKATVDTQSLGLTGYGYQQGTALNAAWFTTNGGSTGGTTTINFAGAGFSDSTSIGVTVNLQGVGDVNGLVNAINAGISQAAQAGTPQAAAFKAANIVASANASGKINFTSSTNAFMVTDSGSAVSQGVVNGAAGAVYGYAQGTARQNTTAMSFVDMVDTDSQTLTFSANNNGVVQKKDITLSGATTAAQALTAINSALQASGLDSLKSIVAVSDGTGKIGFTSTSAFNLTVGAETNSAGAPDSKGFTATAGTYSASVPAGDSTSTVAIDTISGAQAAVSALASAVKSLGQAQAIVGKSENVMNYATSLASTQLTNLASSESQIRDADLAAQAANLSKAQILSQAGVAALAQANSAPQAVLSLLKG